jgi:cysteine synthase A
MEGAIKRAQALAKQTPNSFLASQFENPANPEYHEQTTGQEILEQMDGRIDAAVIGAGTGGTFTGVARALKERLPRCLTIAVETEGSILGGGKPAPHKVEGIGASFIPKTFDGSLADEIIAVSDDDAFTTVAELAAKEGVLCGSSTGANVFAALKVARRLGPGKRIVTIAPDGAERYMSKGIFEKVGEKKK